MNIRILAAIQTFFMAIMCWMFAWIGNINVFWLLVITLMYQANVIMNELKIGELDVKQK